MMRTITFAGVAGLSLAALFSPALAGFNMCSEARKPWCLDNPSSFKSDFAFSSCRSDLRHYLDQVESYVQCLRREQNEAIRESNDAVDRFNCYAKGGTFC